MSRGLAAPRGHGGASASRIDRGLEVDSRQGGRALRGVPALPRRPRARAGRGGSSVPSRSLPDLRRDLVRLRRMGRHRRERVAHPPRRSLGPRLAQARPRAPRREASPRDPRARPRPGGVREDDRGGAAIARSSDEIARTVLPHRRASRTALSGPGLATATSTRSLAVVEELAHYFPPVLTTRA